MDEKVLENSMDYKNDVFNLYYLNKATVNDTNVADDRDGKYVDIDVYGNFKRINKRKQSIRESYSKAPKETIMRDRRFDGLEVSKIHSFSDNGGLHSNLCVDVHQSKRQCCVRLTDPMAIVQMQF